MAANGNYGTGHNSFFMSPDGTEVWVSSTGLRYIDKRGTIDAQ